MDTAINAQTSQIVHAWSLGKDASYLSPYEEKWYADPNNIESYDKEKVKNIREIEVRYRKASHDILNWNGTQYSIAPCFFILNKDELGINTLPESKEHRMAKNWVYNRIRNRNLSFIFSTIKRPFEYNNTVTLDQMNIDLTKVGIEVVVQNNRTQRADVIISFKERDPIFGAGIVIEIQFSKQWLSTEQRRSYEWAFKGYSICWLHIDDFNELTDSLIELKVDKLIVEPVDKVLYDYRRSHEQDIREKIQTLARMVDAKMEEFNRPFILNECNRCHQGFMHIKTTKKEKKKLYGCSNYPLCKHSIWFNDETD